jgi:hypothetical protein
MGYAGEQVPIRGEFSSADARAVTLNESQARFTLYVDGSTSTVTLNATDRVIINTICAAVGATMSVEIYDGSDDTVDAGESLIFLRGGTAFGPFGTNLDIACKVGTYPKVETSALGQVDVVFTGVVVRGAAT